MTNENATPHPQPFFRVVLSTKHEVLADADEIGRVVEAIKAGTPCRLRQGIVNPSYVVAVVEDEGRARALADGIRSVTQHNAHDRDYNGGRDQKPYPVFRPLKDILAGVALPGSAPALTARSRA